MFICIKKQHIYNIVFSLALAVSLISLYGNSLEVSEQVSALPASNLTVVIDPGHGGRDGGAVGNYGAVEKDINLELSKSLGDLFNKSGARVIYTRETDISLGADEVKKGESFKRRDMSERRAVRDENDADLFISIHMNKFTDPVYSGAQVFYNSSDKKSRLMAKNIQSEIRSIADPSNNREAKDSKNNIYLLNDSKIPSVLIECGFLSNYDEELRLLDGEYREKLAFAIYSGVLKYLNETKELH